MDEPQDFNDNYGFNNYEEQESLRKVTNTLIESGLTAVYVSEASYQSALANLDKSSFIVYTYANGDEIVILSDNEIDVVRLRFQTGKPIRDA